MLFPGGLACCFTVLKPVWFLLTSDGALGAPVWRYEPKIVAIFSIECV